MPLIKVVKVIKGVFTEGQKGQGETAQTLTDAVSSVEGENTRTGPRPILEGAMHNLSLRLLIIGVAAAVVLTPYAPAAPPAAATAAAVDLVGAARLDQRPDDSVAPPDGTVTGPEPSTPDPSSGPRPTGTVTGPSAGTNAPLSGPGADAPSNNLAWIGQAIRTRTKSTTVVVEIPAGIPVTGPVAINVRFGGRVVDQTYAAGTGNRILHNYGVGGPARHETVNVRLVESATGLVYAMDLTLTIEPLYDVTIGALHFDELAPCDLIAEADPEIGWRNAEGKIRNAEPEVVDGTAKVDNFADTYTEVALANGLLLPEVRWWDGDLWLDFHGFNFGAIAEQPLLPTTSRPISWVQDEADGQCNAAFSYELTVQLRWYPNL